jgi:hypothetical protein
MLQHVIPAGSLDTPQRRPNGSHPIWNDRAPNPAHTAATLELPTTQAASRRRHACTSYWQTEDCVYERVFSYPIITEASRADALQGTRS